MKVDAVGVNYYDTLIRAGAVSRDIALPHVGGSDVVGVIEATGEDVTGFAPGQKVIVAPGYPTDVAEQAHRPENEARSYFLDRDLRMGRLRTVHGGERPGRALPGLHAAAT